MSIYQGHLTSSIRRAVAIAGVASLGWASAAQAQTTPAPASEGQIVDALMPKALTRGLSTAPMAVSPAAAADAAFIESLKSRPVTSLSPEERTKLASVASKQPSIDLEIPFGYNSARITGRAIPAVKALGAALSNRDLKGGTFLIAGHTDGRGSARANQTLSERRAEAVKRYIVQNFGVMPSNMISVGYGPSRLKNTSNPLADENRRVEVSNVSDVKSSSR